MSKNENLSPGVTSLAGDADNLPKNELNTNYTILLPPVQTEGHLRSLAAFDYDIFFNSRAYDPGFVARSVQAFEARENIFGEPNKLGLEKDSNPSITAPGAGFFGLVAVTMRGLGLLEQDLGNMAELAEKHQIEVSRNIERFGPSDLDSKVTDSYKFTFPPANLSVRQPCVLTLTHTFYRYKDPDISPFEHDSLGRTSFEKIEVDFPGKGLDFNLLRQTPPRGYNSEELSSFMIVKPFSALTAERNFARTSKPFSDLIDPYIRAVRGTPTPESV